MPIREYLCNQCGHLSEYIYNSSGEKPFEVKPCRKCKAKAELVLSAPSPPQFKGTGFYNTDYKEKK